MRTIIGLLACICVLTLPVGADVISLRADEWCPYNCDPGSDESGYMIEIVTLVFEKAGHTIDYQTLSWSRAVLDAQTGKYTGLIGATKAEVPEFIFPEEPLGVASDFLWVKKGNPWRYAGVDSLKQIKLGAIQDYDYGEEVLAYMDEHKDSLSVQVAVGEKALEKNITKLEMGRIDALIENKAVFQYTVHGLAKADLFEEAGEISDTLENNLVYIAFSPALPQSQEYARILTEGIRELRASGEFQKILDRYGVSDWK